jgi:adenine/guanine/hypoxanthine permease
VLDRFFRLAARGTTVRTEVMAGLITFLTMAYIIFVQPAVLSTDLAGKPTGLDLGAVLVATCVGSALASVLMGLVADYPIALAPGMGENFFFVTVVMALAKLGVPDAWQTALGMVFLSGLAFILLTVLRVREAVIDAISPGMRNGIAVGIGLFIASIGLQHAGLIVGKPGTLVGLAPTLKTPDVAVFAIGLVTAAVLLVRGVRGSLLWGILAASAAALAFGRISYAGVFGFPEVHGRAAFSMDIGRALDPALLPFVIVFLFMGLFDSVGTLVGVAEQAGLMEDNRLPRANRALLVDATGITAGACLGTSTITCYIESAAGVAAGGRTGLTAVVTGALFVAALFLGPLVKMVASYPPITAPALVLVGTMMMQNVRKIAWDDPSEALPIFLTVAGIPLSSSIADGLALGFVSHPVVKLLGGKGRDVHWLSYVIAGLLVAYFLLVRSRLGGISPNSAEKFVRMLALASGAAALWRRPSVGSPGNWVSERTRSRPSCGC